MKVQIQKKLLSSFALLLTFVMLLGVETAYASESIFSNFWFQDTDGSWKVKDGSGNIVKNAWLCDDAVSANGQNVWYLLDSNGNMITSGLVQDQTGNYYSLETNHNGFYGMLRYQSGSYDGINLSLESSHSGGFAKILNQEGINSLSSKYGVTNVNIDNSNCVYTSTFKSCATGGSSSSGSNQSSSQTGGNGSNFWDEAAAEGKGQVGDTTIELPRDTIEAIQNATYY